MKNCQRCHICNGNGLVENGFYRTPGDLWASSNTTPEKCRSCNGQGIVWTSEVEVSWSY